jgi:hypothetical protein
MNIEYDITLLRATEDTTEIVRRPNPFGEDHLYDGQRPSWFIARMDFPTLEDSNAFSQQFPKSLLIKSYTVTDGTKKWASIKVEIALSPDHVNKGINENGIRRIQTLVRHCHRLGVQLVKTHCFGNSSDRNIEDFGWIKRNAE